MISLKRRRVWREGVEVRCVSRLRRSFANAECEIAGLRFILWLCDDEQRMSCLRLIIKNKTCVRER